MPDTSELAGDYSALRSSVIYDQLASQPFPGNKLPPSRVDDVSRNLVRFFPESNQPSTAIQNYRLTAVIPTDASYVTLRATRALTPANGLSISVTLQHSTRERAQFYGFRDASSGNSSSLESRWTFSHGRRITGELRGNYSDNKAMYTPFFVRQPGLVTDLGIQTIATDALAAGPPNLVFTNVGSLRDGNPVDRVAHTITIDSKLVMTSRRHDLSFGSQISRLRINERPNIDIRGTLTFTGLRTSSFGPGGEPRSGTGYDVADFLLGLPHASSIRYSPPKGYFRATSYTWFAQDEWKISPSLTMNGGIRYEYLTPFAEKYGRLANLQIEPGFGSAFRVTPASNGLSSDRAIRALIEPDRQNFAPRVSLAWNSPYHVVLRGGYGVYYNNAIYEQLACQLFAQPPFGLSARIQTSAAMPLYTATALIEAVRGKAIGNTYAVDPHYRVGYAQTWTVSFQRDLTPGIFVEGSYLGTKGTRLDVLRAVNQSQGGSPLTAESRRPIQDAGSFLFESSDGNSIYHGAQLRVVRRLRRGVGAAGAYTLSKAIDNTSTFSGVGGSVAQDADNLRSERAVSIFDRRHTLDMTVTLAVPGVGFSAFARGIPAKALLHWMISANLRASSGPRFTATVLGNRSDLAGTGVIGAGRADATGDPVRAGAALFNTHAFVVPPPGRFGNAGRHTIGAPVTVVLNSALIRTFPLGEDRRRRLDVRIESLNATNTVNITGLATTVNAIGYGLPTAAGPMRVLQMQVGFGF